MAHSDWRPPAKLATFKDVHDALGLVGETFQRTHRLLTSDLCELETVLDYDWQAVFAVPWRVRRNGMETAGRKPEEIRSTKDVVPR